MTKELTKRIGRGVIWNILGQILQQAVTFVVILVLVRLIEPKDFGSFAMVLVFTEFISPIREWGFQAVLIQRNEIDEEYRSTAFWSICCIGIMLFLLSLLFAKYIAVFFQCSELEQIIPVIGIGFLLSPFGGVQWALLNRELRFQTLAMRNTITTFGYGAVVCILAWRGLGIWSLVWAYVFREFLWSVIFWFVHDWRPRFKFNVMKFKEMVHFGLNCTGSVFLSKLVDNIDNLFVGKFLGPAKLGFYNLAFNTVSLPKTKFIYQITKVIFPAYSLIQHEQLKLQIAYTNTVKAIMLIVTPMLAILFISANDFVMLFYGAKWLPAVFPIKIMCFYGFLHAVANPASAVFLSKGRPDMDLKIMFARFVLLVASLYFGIRYGINGVALAVLVHSVVTVLPTLYFANRLLEIGHAKFYRSVFGYICLYFLVAMAIWVVNQFLFFPGHGFSHAMSLAVNVVCGMAVYCVLLLVFLRQDFFVLFHIIQRIFLKHQDDEYERQEK